MQNKNLYKVSDESITTRYIRAENPEEAKKIFESENSWRKAKSITLTDKKIQAIYFTDNPYDPAYFIGSKTQARRGGMQYIRQWGLDATIARIETV